jgi:phage terminase large subunit-like protein
MVKSPLTTLNDNVSAFNGTISIKDLAAGANIHAPLPCGAGRRARMRPSEAQADFAKVLVAFLMAERFHDVLKWKLSVDNGFHAGCVDSADHVHLMLTAADEGSVANV